MSEEPIILPGIGDAAANKLAELEARLAALEELIRNLIAKYFGTHL